MKLALSTQRPSGLAVSRCQTVFVEIWGVACFSSLGSRCWLAKFWAWTESAAVPLIPNIPPLALEARAYHRVCTAHNVYCLKDQDYPQNRNGRRLPRLAWQHKWGHWAGERTARQWVCREEKAAWWGTNSNVFWGCGRWWAWVRFVWPGRLSRSPPFARVGPESQYSLSYRSFIIYHLSFNTLHTSPTPTHITFPKAAGFIKTGTTRRSFYRLLPAHALSSEIIANHGSRNFRGKTGKSRAISIEGWLAFGFQRFVLVWWPSERATAQTRLRGLIAYKISTETKIRRRASNSCSI